MGKKSKNKQCKNQQLEQENLSEHHRRMLGLREKFKHAMDGDTEAAKKLVSEISGTVEGDRVIKELGDLSVRARKDLIGLMDENEVYAFAIEGHLKQMQKDMLRFNSNTLEEMMVERILNCWLIVHELEMQLVYVQNPKWAKQLFKQLLQAHEMYTESILKLDKMRQRKLSVRLMLDEQLSRN